MDYDESSISSSFPSLVNPIDPLPLPPELTSEIFIQAFHERISHQFYPWHRCLTPLTLGWVCRSWRNFAWVTPDLWSTVLIGCKGTSEDNDKTKLDLLREWLSRAHGVQLQIYLEDLSRYEDDVESPSPPFAIINLLKEHHTQWRAIYLRFPSFWCGMLGDADNKHSFPRLQSFYFEDLISRESDVITGPLDLTNAPLLDDLTLEADFEMFNSKMAFIFPMTQITRVSTRLSTMFDLQRRSLLPNLTEAHFKELWIRYDDLQTTAIHPKIRSLHLNFRQDENPLKSYLMNFAAPAVRTLEVDYRGHSPDLMMNTILPFVLRSQCSLTHLYLNILNIDSIYEQDLIKFLATSPHLKELHIHDLFQNPTGLSRTFFEALDPCRSSGQPYLPLLEALCYEGPLHLKPEEFLEPLVSRATLYKDAKHTVTTNETAVTAILQSIRIAADLFEGVASPQIRHTDILEGLRDPIGNRVFKLSNRDGFSWDFWM